jgi:hypothetical protein
MFTSRSLIKLFWNAHNKPKLIHSDYNTVKKLYYETKLSLPELNVCFLNNLIELNIN